MRALRRRPQHHADLLIEARVEAALINGEGRPRRFPKEWIARFLPSA